MSGQGGASRMVRIADLADAADVYRRCGAIELADAVENAIAEKKKNADKRDSASRIIADIAAAYRDDAPVIDVVETAQPPRAIELKS